MASSLIFSQKSEIKFTEYDLDNGLHVILHEDHTTPIVAVSVLYHVGSKNETAGKTGYAHFFEHLMFEEAKNIKRDEYAKIVQSVGGTLNANTSNDRTYYHAVLPSNQLELGLWMESERMLNAIISQAGVDNQREVVKEEKRTSDNQPYSSFFKELLTRMFPGEAYGWTPIGSFEDLNNAKISDFQDFYDMYYVPNNATLSIAGDISIEEAKKYIDKYYSTIPKGTKKMNRPEVNQSLLTKETVDTVYDNIQLPAVIHAYKTVPQGTEDAYALEMLSTVLSGGKSARLNKELVDEKQVALQAAGFPMTLEKSGFFAIFGLPNQGKKLKDVETGVDGVIAKLQKELISEKEFQKVKNQTESGFIRSNSRVAGISESLANYHVYFGDANLINTELDKYNKVTREDIMRVAKKYLVPSNRVVLYYLPKKK
jgi:predicted Zn-dependent peptidase